MLISPLGPAPDEDAPSSGGGGTTSSSGGSSGFDEGGSAGQAGDGVTASGGRSGQGGGVASAGAAGDSSGGANDGACETNADCSRAGFDEPYRCLPDHTCVALKSPECPLVIGEANQPHAVFVGGYATREGATGLTGSTEASIYELALDEFNGERIGGLPNGPGGVSRPLVMVVCDNASAYLDASLKHLTESVQVPAVLAAVDTGQLLRAFELSPNTFFLSPYGGSHELSIEPDQGMIWSMLGQPSDFDAIYAATLARLERFIRASSTTEVLRVATIQTDDAFSNELAEAVLSKLDFNQKSVSANLADGNYLGRVIKASEFADKLGELVADVVAFQPHVVISLANELFVINAGILPKLESDWGLGVARPYYLLSPKNTDLLESTVGKTVTLQLTRDAQANQRYLALGAAPAENRDLYNQFQLRLRNRFPTAHSDAENIYDAAYFLTYSLYAAGSLARIDGQDVARGMSRLVSSDVRAEYRVGPEDISAAFVALSRPTADIRLVGTLGPPDFDTSAGVRVESGSVTCFDGTGRAHYHVLRYDRPTGQLQGDFSTCYAGF